MKCPKYIKDKIMRRAELAVKFMKLDGEIAEWINKQEINSVYRQVGYVEALCGGRQAAEDCLKDIEEA